MVMLGRTGAQKLFVVLSHGVIGIKRRFFCIAVVSAGRIGISFRALHFTLMNFQWHCQYVPDMPTHPLGMLSLFYQRQNRISVSIYTYYKYNGFGRELRS